jgi:hypothetical protein
LLYLLQLDAASLFSILEDAISDLDFVPTSTQAERVLATSLPPRPDPTDPTRHSQPAQSPSITQLREDFRAGTIAAHQTVLDVLMMVMLGIDDEMVVRKGRKDRSDDESWVKHPRSPSKVVFTSHHQGHLFHFLAKVPIDELTTPFLVPRAHLLYFS